MSRAHIWNSRSLATQFLVTGGAVAILTMVVIGALLTYIIEDAVIRNAGATTALYVDSVIAPLLPDMQTEKMLDEGSAQALDEALTQGALGKRLVSFKLWRGDGTVLYSNEKSVIGTKFAVNDKLRQAFAGSLTARYEVASDPESAEERMLGKPLMEIYNPVLQPWSGQPVAVLEFYETAEGLGDSLARARIWSWASVACLTATFFFALSALVFRGSRLIERQRSDLRDQLVKLSSLLAENKTLQRRLQNASERAAALNESFLRKVGADLHDGPVQHIAYASLRLDSDLLVEGHAESDARQKELSWIQSSLAEAMTEIRTICRGLMLPQIENSTFEDIIERVVEAHQGRTKTKVDVEMETDDSEISNAVRICTYRFVQEALNNAYRHGGGASQSVKAELKAGRIRIEVHDDGSGFDLSDVRPTSIGLAGLRERVESLGGKFEISSDAEGTVVIVTLRSAVSEDAI